MKLKLPLFLRFLKRTCKTFTHTVCLGRKEKSEFWSVISSTKFLNKKPFKNNREARNALIGLIMTAVNKF